MSGVDVGAPYLMVAGAWACAPATSASPSRAGSPRTHHPVRPPLVRPIMSLPLARSSLIEADLAARAQASIHDDIDQAAGQPLHLAERDDVHALREVVGHGRVVGDPRHADASSREAVT